MHASLRAVWRAGTLGFVASLLMAPRASASEKTDVLYMRNGDRLTCEIKTLNAGSLDVKLDYVDGTISVEWSEVERLDSKRLFLVTLDDGTVFSGRLSIVDTPPDAPVQLRITTESGEYAIIEKTHVVEVLKTSDQFWQRFAVDLSSGFIYSKGNQSTQYNLSTQVTYPRPRWAASLAFNSSLSKSAGVTASTRNALGLTAYHLLPWKNYFYAGQVSFLQSAEQGINVRSNVGGGIGKYVKHSSHVSLALLGGLGWQNTQYVPTSNPEGTEDVLALLLTGSLRVVTFSRTNITLTVNTLPALSEPGRFFFNTNANLYVKLFSNLKLNLSFYGNWDTEPPPTYSGSDYGLSSGLGWTFGNSWTPR